MGRFVITEVAQFIKIMKRFGKLIKISVNASFKELLSPYYVQFLVETLSQNDIQNWQVCIEITESEMAQYLETVLNNLDQLQANGFEIHIDDFGTGYSSLNQLNKLPVNVLKIDKSFIWEIESDQKKRSLTHLIIEVAHKMNLSTIAEGVETDEQLAILKELGCDVYQGYYFSKPKEKEEILDINKTILDYGGTDYV